MCNSNNVLLMCNINVLIILIILMCDYYYYY